MGPYLGHQHIEIHVDPAQEGLPLEPLQGGGLGPRGHPQVDDGHRAFHEPSGERGSCALGVEPFDEARAHQRTQRLVLRIRTLLAPELGHVLGGLLDGDLEILEVDGLDQEVEGAAVHGHADVARVAVGGDDDGPRGEVQIA